ncbi:hypothetical protein EHQ27_09785 [Leptospira wolffii]|uniref:Uncharacterized protein n=1 Tax=Leptospira wolffii TaxID=409998 RepID=A0A2M9Z6W4_9LEPT|nr:hypothetical protein [Leptospira wolffii]PJZ64171.1 hypothetical protein CH371_19745 [Leptospira wolffii]TGK56840.1 hypothetical protein EHQ32_14745 [Leptospira wolffii]TGK71578.1 hypothetical protein EHQ27_09785 [Leptospira wolffii]TGK75565.1 hypothetical protein EHQ35_04120 [Leptospira wolffii]TGL32945.1 hypothetical protein EHQ57_00410 [Leptospira wolffii]
MDQEYWVERFNSLLHWNEKDIRKILRVVSDSCLVTGMTEQETLDFLQYGFEEEILDLKQTYDWILFKGKLVSKLSKRRHEPPGLSILHPDLLGED